jgi:mannan endo-1,4-beta-mannosidase
MSLAHMLTTAQCPLVQDRARAGRRPRPPGRTAAAAALLAVACGTQYGDPILSPPDAGTDVQPGDPCSQSTTQDACLADLAHSCSFEPNLVGCQVEDPACPPGRCGGDIPFVRRGGETLWLHGAPYTFLGAVSWSVAATGNHACVNSNYSTHEQALQQTFDDLAVMRVSALKIWAFQSYAGLRGTDYSSFDRVVTYARRAGVRLLFVLENMWADCTEGGPRDNAWFNGGYATRYGSYALSYREYVLGLVDHFKNEPTLLGWELMHEAQGTDFASLQTFVQDMASLVRATDGNHLLALGLDNGDSPATSRDGELSNYQRLHDQTAIDLLDLHDFNAPDALLPSSAPRQQSAARALFKPIFSGAAAVELTGISSTAFANRGEAVARKMDEAFRVGFVGFLIYAYYPKWTTPTWDFDARDGEPLAGPNGILALRARPNK